MTITDSTTASIITYEIPTPLILYPHHKKWIHHPHASSTVTTIPLLQYCLITLAIYSVTISVVLCTHHCCFKNCPWYVSIISTNIHITDSIEPHLQHHLHNWTIYPISSLSPYMPPTLYLHLLYHNCHHAILYHANLYVALILHPCLHRISTTNVSTHHCHFVTWYYTPPPPHCRLHTGTN